MADEKEIANKPLVRSSKDIKRELIQKAFAGESGRNGTEMIALIMKHTRQASDVPLEHIAALCKIDDNQARAVRMLNLLAEEAGSDKRFTDLSGMKPKTPSLN